MANQKGIDLLIQVDTGSGYETILGLRDTTVTSNNEPVDVTSKSSNTYRKMLPGAGTKSLNVSGAGVYESGEAYEFVLGEHLVDNAVDLKIIFGNGDEITGNFIIPTLEKTGTYNDAQQYSIQFQSNGEYTYTAAP